MYDLIIIGAGPAGLTAALYAGRFRLKTILLEKMAAGGQIILSDKIENYPGFPGGISTQELIDKFGKQVEDSGISIESKEVLEIEIAQGAGQRVFEAKTAEGNLSAKSVIVATGALPKSLSIEGEREFIGRGVSYCGTCDGPLFKNKEITVVGGGDRAIEEAIFLSNYAVKVNLVHRRMELRASKILQEKARKNKKINFILGNVLEKISGKGKVEEIWLKNIQDNSRYKLSCQGVFIFVGIIPNTAFLKKLLALDEQGFIITTQQMQSSQVGLFACGDCCKKSLYQVVTACAEGAVAADSAHRYLMNR